MVKKTAEIVENPDDLTEEEQAAEAEMMAEPEGAEVVAEEEAQGDETLSIDEPKAEETPEEKPEETPEEKAEPTTVPLAALDSERHKRKEAEGRLAVLEDKMTTLLAPKPAEPPAEDKMPDPVVDPEKFEAWMGRRELAASQPVVQMTAQMKQQQEHAELRQFAATSEATFSAENSDYSKALGFARDLKAQEFRMWGYPEDQIPGLVNFSEAQVTTLARERGVNPAQIVYNYAKLHGYKAEAPPENEGDKIARLADVQKQTQSTAGAAGGAREEEWTPERLAGLNDEEMAKVPADVFQRVMGG